MEDGEFTVVVSEEVVEANRDDIKLRDGIMIAAICKFEVIDTNACELHFRE